MAYDFRKRGPQKENAVRRQFKMRCTEDELERLENLARDGVALPARTIPAGVNKSDLVRMALGFTDAEPPKGEPGRSAVEELQRRMREANT